MLIFSLKTPYAVNLVRDLSWMLKWGVPSWTSPDEYSSRVDLCVFENGELKQEIYVQAFSVQGRATNEPVENARKLVRKIITAFRSGQAEFDVDAEVSAIKAEVSASPAGNPLT